MEKFLIGAIAIGLLDRTDKGYAIPADLLPFFDREVRIYVPGIRALSRCQPKIFHFLADAVVENAPQCLAILRKPEALIHFADLQRSGNTAIFFGEHVGPRIWSGKTDSLEVLMKNFSELVDIGGASGSFAIAG